MAEREPQNPKKGGYIRHEVYPNGPKIYASRDISQAPYTITVNGQNLIALYKDVGLSDDKIAKQSLIVKRGKAKNPFIASTFFNSVEISTEPIWYYKNKFTKKAHALIEKDKNVGLTEADKKGFKGVVRSPDRFTRYLYHAPPERAKVFSEKLIQVSSNAWLNEILRHETQHVKDFSNKEIWVARFLGVTAVSQISQTLIRGIESLIKNNTTLDNNVLAASMLAATFLSLPVVWRVAYQFDIMEIRAREAHKKTQKNLNWRVLTLLPKES